MRIWGYWATLAWALLAFAAGQFITLGLLVVWRAGNSGLWLATLVSIMATPFDGALVTLFVLISNPITIAVLALAVWLKRANLAEYLALVWPQTRYVSVGIVCLIGLIAASDAALYLSGRDLVTPFQLQSYTSGVAEGWAPAMLFAAVIMAPAGEEILFRGFLFRGWARSNRTAWPAIVVISLLWSGLHVQYDWTGLLQIFVVGLFLGWTRLRSGSVLLTFLLHALFNLEATIETVIQVRFFS
jgi:membrane protease YdiL (CAAX protease family)